MLNISQVNIVNQGQITGIITKLEFLKKRKQEEKIFREERQRNRLVNIVPNAINQLGQIGSAMMRRAPANGAPANGAPANGAPARSGNVTPRNGLNRSLEHAERLLDNIPD